jgi:hypothetical protein
LRNIDEKYIGGGYGLAVANLMMPGNAIRIANGQDVELEEAIRILASESKIAKEPPPFSNK